RGRYLLAPFNELPPLQEDQVYLHDLIGMKAVGPDGQEIGAVTTFYELPQGLMLDIETPRGSVLFPYRPELVIRTDLEARTILITDALGLIDASLGGEERAAQDQPRHALSRFLHRAARLEHPLARGRRGKRHV